MGKLLRASERFHRLLADGEREQVLRFSSPRERQRYTVFRGGLRAILGNYCRIPGEALEFQLEGRGKPSLTAAGRDYRLSFNLSHAHDCGILAIARGMEIGVDVERIRVPRDVELLVSHFFRPEESEIVHRALPRERGELFCRMWTRKEAAVKCIGGSLPEWIGELPVHEGIGSGHARNDRSPASVTLEGPEGQPLHIVDIPAHDGYLAALCSTRPVDNLRIFELDEHLAVQELRDDAAAVPAGQSPVPGSRADLLYPPLRVRLTE